MGCSCSVWLIFYLPQTLLLGCSYIFILVHLTSPSIACFLASFASFGLSWPYSGVSTWFTVWNRHSCQSRVLLWGFTTLSSLTASKISVLQPLTYLFSDLAWLILPLTAEWGRMCILLITIDKLLFRACLLITFSCVSCRSGQYLKLSDRCVFSEMRA